MKIFIQILLVVWFVLVSAFIMVPSFQLLNTTTADVALAPPPRAPTPPAELDDARVTLYTQEVTAYVQSISAYTKHLQATATSNRQSVYELVVKDTLVSLFGQILTAFVAFAFVKVGAIVLDNRNPMRKDEPRQEISLF